MKKFKISAGALFVLSLVIAAALFLIGKGQGNEHEHGLTVAEFTLIALTEEEKKSFAPDELKVIGAVEKLCSQTVEKSKDGKISSDQLKMLLTGFKDVLATEELKALNTQLNDIKEAAKKQGTDFTELQLKMQNISSNGAFKSIGQVLQEAEPELKKIFNNRSGSKAFLVTFNTKGEPMMRPVDDEGTKAASPHATIDGVGGGTASVSQTIDAATLLRIASNAPIIDQYRNNAWIFDLVNVTNAGWENPWAIWFEEQVKQGGSTQVAEGGTKPKVQYSYALKSSSYKKEAVLLSFTDEFVLDFPRLQDDIMKKGRVDLINNLNTKILTGVSGAATLYNTAAEFMGGEPLVAPTDYDALAAMAAQVDNATFGAMANAAIMSTFKKYRLGVNKSTTGEYVDRPSVISNLNFVSNPDMAADGVMVGDFKQYNVILRGGLIVRIGYNGTDFAENKFSTVIEQYWMDNISDTRKVAIVKGDTFQAVKDAIKA